MHELTKNEIDLEKIEGTHNNYRFLPDVTPYDDLVRTTGIDWQILDRAWLDLTTQGNTEAAAQLRQGTLPPIETFSSEIQAELKPYYDHLAQQVTDDGTSS